MDRDKRIKQLCDDIELLQDWIVDHPLADYYTKKTVVDKWKAKCEECQELIRNLPNTNIN